MTHEDDLVRRQIEYYRARAAEYDEWFLRLGRYDRGEENRRQWFADVAVVRKALESATPRGNILELACGTGLWTQYLVPCATKLVAVDASPEALELCRQRVGEQGVSYVEADLFEWTPTERFDFVFFGFWLSHVPRSRFDAFWAMVAEALAPGGKVYFVDSLFAPESTARNHEPPDHGGRAIRKLNDGTEFEIIKEYYEPEALKQRLEQIGWTGVVGATERFFLYGCVGRLE